MCVFEIVYFWCPVFSSRLWAHLLAVRGWKFQSFQAFSFIHSVGRIHIDDSIHLHVSVVMISDFSYKYIFSILEKRVNISVGRLFFCVSRQNWPACKVLVKSDTKKQTNLFGMESSVYIYIYCWCALPVGWKIHHLKCSPLLFCFFSFCFEFLYFFV